MKKPKQIEGGPGSCLHIVKNPIIVQSRAQTDGTKSPKASYTFREVNFVSEDLDALFVLQNKHQDISLTFRDCHFLSRGYVGELTKRVGRRSMFQVDENHLVQLKTETFSQLKQFQDLSGLKNQKTTILGKKKEIGRSSKGIDENNMNLSVFSSNAVLDSNKSLNKPVKMMNLENVTENQPAKREQSQANKQLKHFSFRPGSKRKSETPFAVTPRKHRQAQNQILQLHNSQL